MRVQATATDPGQRDFPHTIPRTGVRAPPLARSPRLTDAERLVDRVTRRMRSIRSRERLRKWLHVQWRFHSGRFKVWLLPLGSVNTAVLKQWPTHSLEQEQRLRGLLP
jgi:hypothetical protein